MFPRFRLLLVAVVILVLGWLAVRPLRDALRTASDDVRALRRPPASLDPLTVGATLPPLDGAAGWVNGGPLTRDSLGTRLTVIAVFGDARPATLELLPRLEELHEGFARSGLRVVGVQVPEFAVAADTAVTARLARRLGVRFPLALDATRELERTLGGLDPDGRPRLLVADSAGCVIAQATASDDRVAREAIAARLPEVPLELRPPGVAAAGGARPRFLPLGAGRVARGPLADAEAGLEHTYTAQFRYQEQGAEAVPYPVGRWRSVADGLVAVHAGAAQFVAIRYDAPRSGPARVGAFMSPPREGPVRVWVLRDEKWPPREDLGADARLDARGAAYVVVDEPRLYLVARGGGVYKLSPEAPGLRIHALALEPDGPHDRPRD